MKEKKQAMRMVLSVITFTVVLIYLVNHTSVIAYLLRRLIALILPFLIGCGIAFVINIIMKSIEDGLFKKKSSKLYKYKRPISMVLSYILAVLVLALVLFVVIPEVGVTIGKIRDKLPGFVDRTKAWILQYTTKYPEITAAINDIEINWEEVGIFMKDGGTTILSTTVNIFSSIISAVVNIFIGIVFSIYILAQKEKLGRQTKMLIYAMFKENTADELMVFGKIANTTFSKFFTCQFREGIILGSMFVIAMSLFGFSYPLTVGVLMAFTALIPVFGGFIGATIGAFLILVDDPSYLIWFVVLFFALQFIENYFIYPKLVGGDIGLGAIWVLLAVLVGGDLMGVMGMFLFIPLVSVLYAYLRSLVIRKLKYKKIDIDDKEVSDDVVPLMESRRRMFTPKKNKQNQEEVPQTEDEDKQETLEDN
ncbi:MAG: AI-2E family transporter [Lachnospiraceae bacterium]|nr:AI-2E family transporter [Lachnospiraceae bacterium]